MRPAPRSKRAAPRFRAIPLLALLSAGCAGVSSTEPPTPVRERAPAAPPTEAGAYDIVIEGGRVVDGTGNPWFRADVGIRDGRIETLAPPGLLASFPAATRVDAGGLVVAPGFIDIQSHSRSNFLGNGDGRVISKISMGVTTEIMGEATTNAPVAPDRLAAAGRAAGSTLFASFDAWLRAMEAHGASVNFGSFVGASTLRVLGMGYGMGEARGAAIKAMQGAVRQAMEDGAFGVASALIYPPGNFASTDELVALVGASAPYGGVYATHMRSEADRLLEGIDEAIQIGTRAGVPIEIYHLKAAGRHNWPKAAQAIAKIDSARAAGVDIQANMYPYRAGSTGLAACFPPWASADGALYRNLASPERRAAIRHDIEHNDGTWENLCELATPAGTLLVGFGRPEHRRYAGRYLSEIAPYRGTDWIDAAMDLVLAERRDIGTIFFMMSEENVALQLRSRWMKFGTDAGGEDPHGRGGLVHPRAYGTFTRILGRHVRDEGVLGLEEAVRRMTSAVATRLGIRDRGLVAEGFFADIVIFDPKTVSDVATYEEPHAVSEGVLHVLVNGIPVLLDGRHTGALPGRPVRGPGWIGHYP